MTLSDPSIIESLIQALSVFSANHADIHGWKLRAKTTEGRQSLMMSTAMNQIRVYQDRRVTDNSYEVELFVPTADGQQMGTAKGSLDPDSDLTAQLTTLSNNAKLALNPYFELPEKPTTDYPEIPSADPNLLEQLDASHEELLQRIQQHCPGLTSVIVNSAELFCNRHHEVLITSKGVRASKNTTDIYFEVAMEKDPAPNDQEVLKYWHFVSLPEADIEHKLDGVAKETLLTLKATLPPTRGNAALLIDSYAICKMMAAVASQVNAQAEYAQGPHFKNGQQVTAGDSLSGSDQLTISLDPTLPQMAKSTAYTDEGQIAQPATLIENNVVLRQTVDSRMAQYLNKDANHIVGNLVVSVGSESKESLLSDREEVFEILDFSSLLVNPSSLTWSSEIKLGLWHRAGQPAQVLKGGIVSGNIKESLQAFKFSNQQVKRNTTGGYFEPANGYVGPQHMLIWHGVSIAGQQEN